MYYLLFSETPKITQEQKKKTTEQNDDSAHTNTHTRTKRKTKKKQRRKRRTTITRKQQKLYYSIYMYYIQSRSLREWGAWPARRGGGRQSSGWRGSGWWSGGCGVPSHRWQNQYTRHIQDNETCCQLTCKMDHDATLPLQSGSSLCSTGQQHGIAPPGRRQPVPERKRGRGAEGSRTPSTVLRGSVSPVTPSCPFD